MEYPSALWNIPVLYGISQLPTLSRQLRLYPQDELSAAPLSVH